MHARLTRLDMDPGKIDAAIGQLEDNDLSDIKQLDGFKGMTVLSDRDTGSSLAITFWESKEALQASEEAVKGARERSAEAGGASNPSVERYEVVLDTMV